MDREIKPLTRDIIVPDFIKDPHKIAIFLAGTTAALFAIKERLSEMEKEGSLATHSALLFVSHIRSLVDDIRKTGKEAGIPLV